jgi:hypothetical protein
MTVRNGDIDEFNVDFYASENPLDSSVKRMDAFFKAFEQNVGEFRPDKVVRYGKKAQPYSRGAAMRLLRPKLTKSEIGLRGFHLSLYKSDGDELSCSLWFGTKASPSRFHFYLTAKPFSYFQEPERCEERSHRMVSLLKTLAEHYPPTYAIAHSNTDLLFCLYEEASYQKRWSLPSSPTQVEEVFWLNILGKQLVDSIGRERVLSTPAERVEELRGGSVLLLTRPTVTDFDSDEARIAQARALVHLNPALKLDAVLATLRERSARLAPIERDWDPDVADVLALIVDSDGLTARRRNTVKFNQFRPPPVSEWFPLVAMPRTDVADVEAELKRYRDNLLSIVAKHFRKYVPDVAALRPESLPMLDYETWRHDHPSFPDYKKNVIDVFITPSLGAYLGELLVQRLGGRWVPRQSLVESYVILGERAWLPFLRAQHALETQQSTLDYSLTQFFNAAKRHLRSLQPSA